MVNFKMIAQMVMVFCVGQMEKYNTAENGKMDLCVSVTEAHARARGGQLRLKPQLPAAKCPF